MTVRGNPEEAASPAEPYSDAAPVNQWHVMHPFSWNVQDLPV